MKFKINYFILLFLLGLTIVAQAQGDLGQAGANFLQIGVEPRGAALGGAVTALSEGAAALYWNPAGAIFTESVDLNLSQTNWFLDTKLMYGAIVKNFGVIGAFGVSVTSFYMDQMEITTVAESEGTGEFYDAGDLAIGLSYARTMTDRFTFGLTTKLVREYIWNQSASQVAFDVGSVYRTDFLNLRIGMAVRNFSGKLKFEGEDIDQRIAEEVARNQSNNPRIERLTPEFRLPQVFQMGIAFDPVEMRSGYFTLLVDVDVPSDNVQRMIFGAEYGFHDTLFLRGAYRVNYDSDNFSFGGGLNLGPAGLRARLDYSFSGHELLGSVHRFGFGLSL